jgi:hypothetical protein
MDCLDRGEQQIWASLHTDLKVYQSLVSYPRHADRHVCVTISEFGIMMQLGVISHAVCCERMLFNLMMEMYANLSRKPLK